MIAHGCILGMISHVWSCKGFRNKYFWNPKATCRLFNFMVYLVFYLIVVGSLPLTIHLSTMYIMVRALNVIVHIYITNRFISTTKTFKPSLMITISLMKYLCFSNNEFPSYKHLLVHIFLFQTFALHSLLNKPIIHKTLSYTFSL